MRSAFLLCWLSLCAGSNEFGKKFLQANKQKEGVTTLSSGLQYKVLREGEGEAHPLRDTQCECHYEGRTAQEWSKEPKGKKFDSSYDRGSPTSFAPSGVIRGWTEAMQLMVEGDKWELYIPSDLAYGESGQGGDIKGGDVLVFTIEIIKIQGASKPAERGPPPYTDIATKAALDSALSASGSKPFVLGLFRLPLQGKLFDSFRGAARKLSKSDSAEFGLSALSKYDPKTKKYGVSEVEAALGLSAPGLFVSHDGGASWIICKTSFSQKSVTVDDVKEKIAACVAPAKDEV